MTKWQDVDWAKSAGQIRITDRMIETTIEFRDAARESARILADLKNRLSLHDHTAISCTELENLRTIVDAAVDLSVGVATGNFTAPLAELLKAVRLYEMRLQGESEERIKTVHNLMKMESDLATMADETE